VNIIAAITQYAMISVDITNLGFTGDDTFQTCCRR